MRWSIGNKMAKPDEINFFVNGHLNDWDNILFKRQNARTFKDAVVVAILGPIPFNVLAVQCDQIGRLIGLWASFKAFGNNYFTQINLHC